MPVLGQYIGNRAYINIKGNGTTSDSSVNKHTIQTGNTSNTTGITDESDTAIYFANNSYLRSTGFNTAMSEYETIPMTLLGFFRSDNKFYLGGSYQYSSNYNTSTSPTYKGFSFGYGPGLLNVTYYKSDGSSRLVGLSKSISALTWYYQYYTAGLNFFRVGSDGDSTESTDPTDGMSPTIIGQCGLGTSCGTTGINSGYHFNGKMANVRVYRTIIKNSQHSILRKLKGRNKA